MLFGKKLLLGTKLLCVGVVLFGTGLSLAATNLLFLSDIWVSVRVLGFMQLLGLLVSLIGITMNAMDATARNKWLTIVGIAGIIGSILSAIMYGAIPLLEIRLGGTGNAVFEKFGLYFDMLLIPPLAVAILFISVQILIWSVQLFTGETRFQR